MRICLTCLTQEQIEIALQFFTGSLDISEIYCDDFRVIGAKYLSTPNGFCFDIITSLPWSFNDLYVYQAMHVHRTHMIYAHILQPSPNSCRLSSCFVLSFIDMQPVLKCTVECLLSLSLFTIVPSFISSIVIHSSSYSIHQRILDVA